MLLRQGVNHLNSRMSGAAGSLRAGHIRYTFSSDAIFVTGVVVANEAVALPFDASASGVESTGVVCGVGAAPNGCEAGCCGVAGGAAAAAAATAAAAAVVVVDAFVGMLFWRVTDLGGC